MNERPWFSSYDPGMPTTLPPASGSALDPFLAAVAATPGAPCIITAEATLSYADVDGQSDAIAAWLAGPGVGVAPGDRVALYLQNDPQVVTTLLAAWKVGAVAVPVNPMLRATELAYVLGDSEPTVVVARDELLSTVFESGATGVKAVGLGELDVIAAGAGAVAPTRPSLSPDDPAFLVYTSGTTGKPKGAVNTHGNVLHSTAVYHRWLAMGPDDVILGGAPLFHITGLVAGIALSHRSACPLVLLHRFDAGACLDAIERWRCSMTVMAITAYIALMADERFETADLSSLTKPYSGGAPVSPAVVDRWAARTGSPIRNVYGLTETTSPTHMAPLHTPGRVHPEQGAYSVGVPVPGADVRIGDEGEIEVQGPMVVPGYWRRDDVAVTDADGWFRTGDVGIMDDDGWFYVVDRLKDMINASGFKVWPREVEDVLRQHPSVRDAAVVGVPDDYRGETVKAFVTVSAGADVDGPALIAFCGERLAAYKRPRMVEVLDELPTTATGKVLRRELRDRR